MGTYQPIKPPAAGLTEIQEADINVDPRRSVRIGWGVLLAGVVIFVLWAVMAPIDEGVPAPATVTLETKRKVVQHPTGGVVKKILVKEAQEVREGEPLIQLDDTYARSNYESLRKQYLALRALESRLAAEELGRDQITFHPDVLAEQGDPVVASFVTAEEQSFHSRRAAVQNQKAILIENSRALEEQIKGIHAQMAGKKTQLEFVRRQLEGTRELAGEGYLPRNKLFEEERFSTELEASINSLTSNAAQQGRMLGELKLKIAQVDKERNRDITAQMSSVKRELEPIAERYTSAKLDLDRTVLRAPASGSVMGLAMQTIGGVVAPGGKVMEIVQEGERLLLEAQLPLYMVDRVHAGLPVDVRFSAFIDLPYLVVEGKVVTVSGDRVDPTSYATPPFYLIRVEMLPEGLKKLGHRRLLPGMGADILIKTGKRTFLDYLMRPLTRRFAMSMTER